LNSIEQKNYVLDFVRTWVGSETGTLNWYETAIIPSLNSTTEQANENGCFDALVEHLKSINMGGHA
jgi:hypothetical protein